MIAEADRGGDVGGTLAPLEIRAAQLERDLIVGHAERATLAQQIAQAKVRRQALADRAASLATLVTQVREAVTPAPKYAVPQVDALGDVPSTAESLIPYLAKLDQVDAALNIVEQANQRALTAKADLTTRLTGLRRSLGDRPQSDLVKQLDGQISQLLTASPVPVDVVARLIDAYQAAAGEPT